MTMAASLATTAEFTGQSEGGVQAASAQALNAGAGNLGGAIAAAGDLAIALGNLQLSLNMHQQLREATKDGASTTGR